MHLSCDGECALTSDKTMGTGDEATAAFGCCAASVSPATLPAGGAAAVARGSVTGACSGSAGNLAAGKVARLRVFGDSASSAGARKR